MPKVPGALKVFRQVVEGPNPPRYSLGWALKLATLFLLLVLPALSATASSQRLPDRKRVLVIYSASRLMPAMLAFDEGLRASIHRGSPGGVNLYTEFFDLNRTTPEHDKKWVDYLRWRYSSQKFDLVVAVERPALEFLQKHGAELFPQVPVVFCLFSKNPPASWELPANFTGVLVPPDWDATLRVALRLQPKVREIAVVIGSSNVEKQWQEDARATFPPYEGKVRFSYVTNLKMSNLLTELGHLPPDSAIFWVSFARDASGESFTSIEAVQMAAKAASAPIYASSATSLGYGIVGGRLLDFKKAGDATAETALHVVRGENVPRINTVDTASFYGFDWRQLGKWGLNEHLLPPGSLLEYREPTLWQQYKWEIVGVVGIALLEGLLIAGLLIEREHRKRIDRALKESEKMNASVLASLRSHVAVLDRNGKIIAVNEAWNKFARDNGAGDGTPIGVGANYLEVCRQAADQRSPKAAQALSGIRGVLEGTLPYAEFEYPCDSPGKPRSFLMSVTPLGTAVGGAVVKHTDVTELRQAEAAQQQAETLMNEIVSTVHAIVWRRDAASNRFTFVSKQAEAFLGFPSSLWISEPNFWLNHMHPDDREKALANFRRALRKGQAFECEFRMIAADGRTRWLREIINVVSDNGFPRELAGVTLDVTERKEALFRLRESEERFRRLSDTAPVLIWMSGTDKGCTYFNQPWLDFTGRPLAEQLGAGWAESVHPEDLPGCMETYVSAFDTRRSFRMEYRLRRADGEYRWILDTGVPRFEEDGTFVGYVGSCIDISDRKETEELLLGLSGRLISMQEEERSYIARELHDDVSQRLALLSIELEQVDQSPPSSKAELHKKLADTLKQVSEISSDIHQISHRLHPSKLDNLGLVAATAGFCRELNKQKDIQIEFTDRNIPASIPADVALCLYRVVQESLQNVIRHSGASLAHVELTAAPDGIYLRVTDSGVGFNPHLPDVATGLGMVSMRERLRLVGGQLHIESEPGHGTRVEAWVPLETASSDVPEKLRFRHDSAA
jgi:PAS domain S-box-containing protein